MKTFSKLLFVLLGIIVVTCLVIIICAANPSFTNGLSNITGKFAKSNAGSGMVKETNEDSGESEADIESILNQIEERKEDEKTADVNALDLGLVDETVYTSLDEYYSKMIDVIKNNYHKGSTVTFEMQIADPLFPEWYTANYGDDGSNSNDSFSYDVEYKHLASGCYLIKHVVALK
jgi:hypothetical protein